METQTKINVSQRVYDSELGSFQWGIIVLCSLCLIMDGFDVQAMGYVAPVLIREWGVPNSALGPVFSAALVGVLIGSLGCSMLADRFGRRPMLIAGSLYFAVLTLITAQANTINQMLAIRFIAGIGLGGMMPNATALVGEYSPKKSRIIILMIVGTGFTAGAALGGFVAAWLIPLFGWRSVFYFGGVIPLVIAALMFRYLPESMQYLVLRGKSQATIRKWLTRMEPHAPPPESAEFVVAEEKLKGAAAAHLFREGRAATTLLLWVVNFMNLLNLYFLSSWIPTVVRDAGYTTRMAVLAGTMVQLGGTIGPFVTTRFINRFGFVPTLFVSFLCASLSISAIGQPGLSAALLFTAIFIAGWCVVGGQPGINSLAALFYPTYLRSTGIGWGLGIGRIGAIVGPFVGGQLMALHWTNRELFYAAAVPAFVSAVVTFSLRFVMKLPEPEPAALRQAAANAAAH
ncbi:MAG TPA: MFS transporter [Bryobacteraceae bacterium]|nr:MFS transporter [Bryobacteraceae bacterium]